MAAVLQCLKFSLSTKIQGNCTGLEVTEYIAVGTNHGQEGAKSSRNEKKSPTATSEGLGEKTRCQEQE